MFLGQSLFIPRGWQGPFVKDSLELGQVRLEVGLEIMPEVGVLEPVDHRLGAFGQGEVERVQRISPGYLLGIGHARDCGYCPQ